jgi:hypothetical protein
VNHITAEHESLTKRKMVDTHTHWYPEDWIRAIERHGSEHGAHIQRDEERFVFTARVAEWSSRWISYISNRACWR